MYVLYSELPPPPPQKNPKETLKPKTNTIYATVFKMLAACNTRKYSS